MKASEIISEIEEIVKSQSDGVNSKWRIGRANSASDAKEQHGAPNEWRDWDADSADDAIEAVDYFVDKGMRKEGEGFGGASFVYIFFSGSPQEVL
ncbi:MAG TPA: hypothetical protein VMW74_00700 [Nitrosopumilaceae archaeon]|jgi:hypothetical protein|nr:hypothetical protein [Nitrosopumilaceae archaeon]